MRILAITDLPPFVTGGAEAQAARLIAEWTRAGHEVRCIGRRMADGTLDVGASSIRIYGIPHLRRSGRLLRGLTYATALARVLLSHRRWPDVIYTRFLGEAAITAAVLKASGLLNAPLIATPANTGGNGDVTFLRSIPFSGAIIRLLDRHCNALNLIAPAMERELREAGFLRVRLSDIPNGVPLEAMTRGDAAPAGATQWVCVGRLTHQKGYDVLLDALSLLPPDADFTVSIAGDGPERAVLEARAQVLGLSARVRWLGELRPLEVARLMDDADAFLLPSRYEGMSNAALEALARGRPILVTDCGGIDRYIDPASGWVVPRDDANALAGALTEALLMDRERLRSMGRAARALAEEHFDIRSVAARYLGLFEALRSP